jgi:hypothetical protein
MEESTMKTKTNDVNRTNDRGISAAFSRSKAVLWLALAFVLPSAALASDYPSGASTNGVITQVQSINGMLLFVVRGTLDNGAAGSQAFWIDSTIAGGNLRVPNILSAAAQGKTVSIWNYGDTYAYGGQTGYTSSIETVSY